MSSSWSFGRSPKRSTPWGARPPKSPKAAPASELSAPQPIPRQAQPSQSWHVRAEPGHGDQPLANYIRKAKNVLVTS